MGILYVVATPIGNLKDVTFRALQVLSQVKVVAAEDTRRTLKLLTHYGIRAQLVSFNEHNERSRLPYLLKVLEEGDIALVSDAGTPGVSDPGRSLVHEAHRRGHRVVPVPGPSAAVAALSVSGLQADRFVFLGYLPRKRKDRHELLEIVEQLPLTLVLFEAPHRLRNTLRELAEKLGNRQCLLARELTKMHEEVRLTALQTLAEEFETREAVGEFTLVIEGLRRREARKVTDEVLAQKLKELVAEGLSPRDAIAKVAKEFCLKKREVLRTWHEWVEPSR